MRLNQVMQLMKQLSGKVGSNIYASVQDQTNPQHVSFLRQLQKELNAVDHLDRPLHDLNVVVFDLETTGFYPDHGDHIVSIGAIKAKGTNVQDHESFYSLIYSDHSLSTEIVDLTGITEEDLQSAPPLPEVLAQFYEFIKGHVLVAHHANHEKTFMQHATWSLTRSHFQHRIIDTSFLIRMVHPSLNLVRLEDCCNYCGIDIVGRHHALGDAKMTAQLWSHYLREIQLMGYETLRDVYEHLAKRIL
jgi:DNA polymerase-3 subunit epsilon